MITTFALEEQAKHLQSMCVSGEIEINGVTKVVPLTSMRVGNKVRFFLHVAAEDIGQITRRIIKTMKGDVCWSDPPGSFNLIKNDVDMRIEIPVELMWKGVNP
ncbi:MULTISPECIES: hypothetical protein [Brevibacillus]|uniref:hypothetical protein n=1 Tax=Brevibacillus TaxID=55080 RepID=UPI0004F29305|nr:hypothetical protein [Brevibacillus borstelensis]KKX52556.1 hypothetical protein X546_24410 [Brevibacillus borstelensis cifa_chp40]